jgi:DNA-binding transcriptional LysR family regulator
VQADVIPVERVREGDGFPTCQRVPAGHDQNQPVMSIRPHLKPMVLPQYGGVADAQVGRSFLDCAHHFVYVAMRDAAAAAGRTIKLRVHVTGLHAMCRMIHNGLGVGVMPQRAFELMHGVGELECVRMTDAWAIREIGLVARDFSTLPVTGRLLVDHLCAGIEEPAVFAAA